MEPGTDRFRRSDRLLDSRDYRRVSRRGSRAASNNFVVLVAPLHATASNEASPVARRLGVTVSRKVGNAVVRNRVKRRIREWFRRLGDGRGRKVELVVIARRAATELDSREIASDLTLLLEQAIAARNPVVVARG